MQFIYQGLTYLSMYWQLFRLIAQFRMQRVIPSSRGRIKITIVVHVDDLRFFNMINSYIRILCTCNDGMISIPWFQAGN